MDFQKSVGLQALYGTAMLKELHLSIEYIVIGQTALVEMENMTMRFD